jgi:hypothetical protein
MKKILLVVGWLTYLISINTFSFELNLKIEPTLLKPGNSLLFSYQIYTCSNQPYCQKGKEINHYQAPTNYNAEIVDSTMQYFKDYFRSLGLAGYAEAYKKDSSLSFDIYQDNRPLGLQDCKNIFISGNNQIYIHITPRGCIVK